MANRQFAAPLVMRGGKAMRMVPVERDYESEEALQVLLFAHPTLIPIEDIEPAFGPLLPVAREFATDRGPIDLIFIDPRGNLVLVETKLWRNPEARRTVVGQLVDYASDLQTWTYDELIKELNANHESNQKDPLVERVRNNDKSGEFDAQRFQDAVQKNLTLGRFLLLIVGDRISESVERMVEFLQRPPQPGFSIALLEIAVFRTTEGDKDLFFQPRIVARTVEVKRAVVEIRSQESAVQVSVREPDRSEFREGLPTKRLSFSQEEYYVALAQVGHDLPGLVEATLADAANHQLEVEWKHKRGPVLKHWFDIGDDEDSVNFGQLTLGGRFASSAWLSGKCNPERLNLPRSVWEPYYESLVSLFEGQAKIKKAHWEGAESFELVAENGSGDPPFEPLLRHRAEWLKLIDETIARIEEACRKRTR